MKHIKFEENIEQDEAYQENGNRNDTQLISKIADNQYEDEFEISDTIKWHQNLPEEPIDVKSLDFEQINTLKKEATGILHGESLAYETKMNRGGSSDQKWARSLLSKGAMADRVAAATVLIQDNPTFHLNALRNLVSMVKPAKKKDSLTVIETLSELFISDLLLPEAKLRPFESRALSELEKMSSGNRDHRRKILTNWIFEDQLKEIYGEFIKCLNAFAHDTIEVHKEKAISAMSTLLMHNPEQEKVLLSNIINKLGDPSQKVASKVIYHLCQVLYNHPNMKKVVLDEIEKMLFRPNISPKAQYYGVCFLNQFFLSKDDNKVAENLVRVYFSFFKASIKKGDIDSRLMSAILTGVKRCQPFLGQQKLEEIQTQADALHRLVHLARYNISLHALALLFQISPLATQLSDRYYCALYKKLADPETLTTTLPALMMNLVYRSIKADKCQSRVLAFLKRLLQLASMADAPRACSFLLLIARLARSKKLPMQWIEKDEVKISPDSVAELGNNCNEGDIKNANEDTQNSNENLNEDNKSKKKKKTKLSNEKKAILGLNINNTEKKTLWIGDKMDLLNEDDDEIYHDIPLEEDEEEHKRKIGKLVKNKKSSSQGWIHIPNVKTESEIKKDDEPSPDNLDKEDDTEKEKKLKILLKKTKNLDKVIKEYNPLNRNPAYCGAEYSVMCELLQLSEHYHPTVRLFAGKIMNRAFIQYNGDPLIDFSIARFLDRFAFKNPKKDVVSTTDTADGVQKIKTIKGSHPKFAQRKNYLAGGLRSLAVNSAAYLNENSEHIPVDEKFLYDYLQLRKPTEDDSEAESDADSVNSDDFDQYLDGLTGKKKDKDDSDDSQNENEGELDYMKEMLDYSKIKGDESKRRKNKEVESEDEDEDEPAGEIDADWSVSEDDSDGLDDAGDEDENGPLSDADNDSDLGFSDDGMNKKATKSKKGKEVDSENESDLDFSDDEDGNTFDVPDVSGMKKKGKKGGIESMFASAEEFATLLEETGTVKGQGTSHALANTDNAHMKQLNWETKRDRWVKGFNKKVNTNSSKKFDKNSGSNVYKGNKNFGKNGSQAGQKRKFSQNDKMQAKRSRR
ncbi:nucleolar complex protein 1 isoform X2 [Arctopsyche grandis]|uniref:nucleolar complex protein 1 isoform X2 n=1 Tax=Arctopsyche grandis TaxID=121162 RepID=UPI00406D7A2B